MNWAEFAPFFTEAEFRCKHSGLCEMNPEFMRKLLEIRKAYDAPMPINSGYRDKTHPVEARKVGTGEHALGNAADIGVHGANAYRLIVVAMSLGIFRIGVKQHGEFRGRFIHLGWGGPDLASPTVWSYS